MLLYGNESNIHVINLMEEQLIDPNFNVVDFLEKNLTDDDLDMNLTDLIFTLNMIQVESNEKLKLAEKYISILKEIIDR